MLAGVSEDIQDTMSVTGFLEFFVSMPDGGDAAFKGNR